MCIISKNNISCQVELKLKAVAHNNSVDVEQLYKAF